MRSCFRALAEFVDYGVHRLAAAEKFRVVFAPVVHIKYTFRVFSLAECRGNAPRGRIRQRHAVHSVNAERRRAAVKLIVSDNVIVVVIPQHGINGKHINSAAVLVNSALFAVVGEIFEANHALFVNGSPDYIGRVEKLPRPRLRALRIVKPPAQPCPLPGTRG